MFYAEASPLTGVLLVHSTKHVDERGYFRETFSKKDYERLGIADDFVQENVSRSDPRVLRGLHGSLTMSKLVQCLVGKIHDVVVDIRKDSPTYGQWQAYELNPDDGQALYVPKGFLHGFYVCSGTPAIVHYKQSEYYDGTQLYVHWSDPQFNVQWPDASPILSERDRSTPFLNP